MIHLTTDVVKRSSADRRRGRGGAGRQAREGDAELPGYPQGLAGEEVPLGARIIAVVDAFDATTTDRAYRRARSTGAAVEVLRAERGRQLDPRVVDVFLELLTERPWR